jgi:hypothetical protein
LEKHKNSPGRGIAYERYAIDQQWKEIQRSGGWYSSLPMLGEQTASYSDIGKGYADYSFQAS